MTAEWLHGVEVLDPERVLVAASWLGGGTVGDFDREPS